MWAAAVAATALFTRHTLQVLAEVRREQRAQRIGRARAHAATLHEQCHCTTQTMVRIDT